MLALTSVCYLAYCGICDFDIMGNVVLTGIEMFGLRTVRPNIKLLLGVGTVKAPTKFCMVITVIIKLLFSILNCVTHVARQIALSDRPKQVIPFLLPARSWKHCSHNTLSSELHSLKACI